MENDAKARKTMQGTENGAKARKTMQGAENGAKARCKTKTRVKQHALGVATCIRSNKTWKTVNETKSTF